MWRLTFDPAYRANVRLVADYTDTDDYIAARGMRGNSGQLTVTPFQKAMRPRMFSASGLGSG